MITGIIYRRIRIFEQNLKILNKSTIMQLKNSFNPKKTLKKTFANLRKTRFVFRKSHRILNSTNKRHRKVKRNNMIDLINKALI